MSFGSRAAGAGAVGLFLAALLIAFLTLGHGTPIPRIEVHVDCPEGLMYLTDRAGGITPRLSKDGTHMRGSCDGPQ